MCLQPVLEGNSVLLKKINEVIHPADGFTIVATANTKGKGSDDGRYGHSSAHAVPEAMTGGEISVVPFHAGETIAWRAAERAER